MNPLAVTLCCDGSSDRMLLPIVAWTLRQHLGPGTPIDADFSTSGGPLPRRLRFAREAFAGSDLFVVHRDAEARGGEAGRRAEIAAAVAAIEAAGLELPPHVAVVPVVMSEAWLLFDEDAIRHAAGNPRGKRALNLPSRPDAIAEPKQVLHAALDAASELSGRKLRIFQRDRRPFQVANRIDDFAPLRQLAAFKAFEADIAAFAANRPRVGRWTT